MKLSFWQLVVPAVLAVILTSCANNASPPAPIRPGPATLPPTETDTSPGASPTGMPAEIAAPEPLYTLSGTGNHTSGPLDVPAGLHRATVRYDGPGTLTLWATAPDGSQIQVADRMVLRSGAIPLTQAGGWTFDISAEGDWSLTIEPLPQEPTALAGIKGGGNYVSGLFTPEAGRQSYLYVHDGDGPFEAWLHCGSDSKLIISVPDRYSTIVPADYTGEACFWEINAQDSNASWSIIAHADKTKPY